MTPRPGQDEAWLPPVALAFYGAATGAEEIEAALSLCRGALSADQAYCYVARLADEGRIDQHVTGLVTPGRLNEYIAEWAGRNLRQRVWRHVPEWQVVDFESLIPPETFVRSDVWRGFLRHHAPALHVLGIGLPVAPGLQARFWFGRTPDSGPFPASASQRLASLAPHLRRAAQARVRLLAADAAAALPEAALEALALPLARYGRDGRFRGANAALRRLAAPGEGLALGPGGLEPARAEDREALAEAIRAEGGTRRLPLARRHAPVPYLAEVIADQEGEEDVLVIVSDPAAPALPRPADLAALFGLSEAQAGLALAIAAGVPLAAHARAEGVPIETLRSRLKAVLARTGCRRRSDLAALLARLPASLAPGP